MINVAERIAQVEQAHCHKLYKEINKIFESTWMPSHNLEHHKRVWALTKELLKSYSKQSFDFSYEFIEALLFAVFFHDTGLTRTVSIEHGKQSAVLAREYLSKHPIQFKSIGAEMLKAIELHDDKEYFSMRNTTSQPTLLSLLSAADDLDAFGAIGVYRYIEIYSMRNISANNIIPSIIENIKKRHMFVRSVLVFDNTLSKKHLKRYRLSIQLLKQLNTKDIAELMEHIKKRDTINTITRISSTDSENLKKLKTEMHKENVSFALE